MYFKKSYIGIFILALSLFMTGCSGMSGKKAQEEKKVIRVGIGGTYYPFCFQEDGEPKGIEVDIWREIGKDLGYDVEFIVSGFSGLFGQLDTGKVDVIAHQLNATPEREKKYLFTETYMYSKIKFAVSADREDINGIDDLDGKRVAAGGEVEKAYIEESAPDKDIEIVIYGDGIQPINELSLGRVDAILQSEPTTLADVKKNNLNVKVVGEPVAIEDNCYPISKDNAELKEKVDEVIKKMHEDGRLSEISKKWLGADITNK